MESRIGRSASRVSNKLSHVANKVADGLVNVGEQMSTREFPIREGLQFIFGIAAIVFGISAAIGIINQEINLVEGAVITAATATSATIAAKINRKNQENTINLPR